MMGPDCYLVGIDVGLVAVLLQRMLNLIYSQSFFFFFYILLHYFVTGCNMVRVVGGDQAVLNI